MRNYSREPLQIYTKPNISSKSNSLGKQIQLKANNKEKQIIIGKYKYLQKDQLGVGYTSKVYKCVEVANANKKYAIKIIDLKKFKGQNLQILEAEINIHQSLIHQNILRLQEVIKTPLFYYIVLEYCPHGTLSQYIKQMKKLTQNNALEIMSQILKAYNFLIQQKVLHRDLKPANILRNGNKWKISDFGFAIRSKFSFKDRLNVGTLLYMAPQSLLSSSQYSIKSDIFSLGIILYEMIQGKTPWQCSTQKQLIQNFNNPIIFYHQYKNISIKQFILKACQINENSRMNKQELLSFSFKDDQNSMKLSSINILSSSNCIKNKKSSQSFKGEESTTAGSMNTTFSFDIIRKNHEVYINSFEYAKLLYSCINNLDSFLINNDNRQIFVLTLFKYLLKEMKHLCNPKMNQSNLKNWNQYIDSQLYIQLRQQMIKFNQKIEKQFILSMKNNQIKIIRAVNRKFPCLSHNAPLTSRFYQNFKYFMSFVIRQHNHELMALFKCKEDDYSQLQALEKVQLNIQVLQQVQSKLHDHMKEKMGIIHCDKIQALQNLYTLYNIAQLRGQQVYSKQKLIQSFNVVDNFKQSRLRINDYSDLRRLIRNL